jgi:ribonuclease T2
MSASVRLLIACIVFFIGHSYAAAETKSTTAAPREVLSVSWRPGYCAARPKSRVCAGFSAAAPSAAQFSLHSRFQVRKSYCGIDAELKQKARKGKWTNLPEVVLADGTRARLATAMPAARAGIERQQWLRSGSCVAASAEAYFSRSLDLLDALNAQPVRALFAEKKGGEVTLAEVRAAFDAAFGAEAGERVRLSCRKADDKTFVVGLNIVLATGEGTLPVAIAAAPSTKSRCTGGLTGTQPLATAKPVPETEPEPELGTETEIETETPEEATAGKS